MPLNIAIVEDSQDNIEILQYHLEKTPHDVEIKGIAKTIREAELLLTRPDIDLAFLDIQLKEGTIFDVLEDLQKNKAINFEMVFVTAHGSYENALKAIRFACLDFINKPVDQEELDQTLGKVSDRVSNEQGGEQVKHLLELIRGNTATPANIGIVLPRGVIEFVEVNDILFITADQTICRVTMTDGRILTSAKHLGYYIDLLSDNEGFAQSGKSHLVNLSHVKQYDHRERTIRFNNGEHLIASHRFSKEIRKRLMDRQKGGGFLGLDRIRDLLK